MTQRTKRTGGRLLALLLCIALLSFPLPVFAGAKGNAPVLTDALAGGVCNASRGEVLYALNRDLPVFPAATVKMMTAMIALDYYADAPDTLVPITKEAEDAEGVTLGFKTGEEIAARDLIGVLVVGCANDAAVALARGISGSVSEFVKKMNATAAEYGMTGTHYENPTGLHEDTMVTTVGDTLLLAMRAARNSEFTSLCAMPSYTVPKNYHSAARTMSNRNYFISSRLVSGYYDPGITGMNYGSTYEAGGCLVASTVWQGEVFISAVFGAPTARRLVSEEREETDEDGNVTVIPAVYKNTYTAYPEAKTLLAWAKESFRYFTAASPSVPVGEIPVELGKGVDSVSVFPKEELLLYLPSDVDPETDLKRELVFDHTSLTAPVIEGEEVGIVRISYEGRLVGEIALITRTDVQRSLLDSVVSTLQSVGHRPAVLRGLMIGAGVLLCVVLISAVVRYRIRLSAAERRREEKEERERSAAKRRSEQINRQGKGS